MFDFPTGASAAAFQTEARRRKHVALILHTGTTQLTGGCHTSLSTSPHHQLLCWLMLHDCCIYRPTFNIIISSSSSVISISDCVIDVLTFIVSLFCCSSSCGQVGVKIVLLIFWNFISESSIEFLKVYFKFTTDQSRFLSDIHAKRFWNCIISGTFVWFR